MTATTEITKGMQVILPRIKGTLAYSVNLGTVKFISLCGRYAKVEVEKHSARFGRKWERIDLLVEDLVPSMEWKEGYERVKYDSIAAYGQHTLEARGVV